MRVFLCRREAGNVLVYASSALESEAAEIERLGGASRHYLGHRHEAALLHAPLIRPIVIHEHDREDLATTGDAVEVFAARHMLDGDFEAIPTPGHTPGATAYLWDTGEHRVLFTGDTVYLSEGEWVAAVLDSSGRNAYVASLELIRGLEFNVLAPWIAPQGHPGHDICDSTVARRRIGRVLARVSRGASR